MSTCQSILNVLALNGTIDKSQECFLINAINNEFLQTDLQFAFDLWLVLKQIDKIIYIMLGNPLIVGYKFILSF